MHTNTRRRLKIAAAVLLIVVLIAMFFLMAHATSTWTKTGPGGIVATETSSTTIVAATDQSAPTPNIPKPTWINFDDAVWSMHDDTVTYGSADATHAAAIGTDATTLRSNTQTRLLERLGATSFNLLAAFGKGRNGQVLTYVNGKIEWRDVPVFHGAAAESERGLGRRPESFIDGERHYGGGGSNTTTTVVTSGGGTGDLTQANADGRYVNISGDTMNGGLTIAYDGLGLNVTGTASGDTIHAEKHLSVSGTTVFDGNARFNSSLTINSVTYSFPASDGAGSGKVLKSDGNGNLSWADDNTVGTGLSIATGDQRYVKKQGDTMTGALVIDIRNGALGTVGLKIVNTLSGANIHAERSLSTSGSLVFEGSASGSSLYIASSLQGAGLTDCDAAAQTLKWDASTGRFSCGTDINTQFSNTGSLQNAFDARYVNTSGDTMTGSLAVRATLSGSRLVISGNANITGALLTLGNITTRGTLSGSRLVVSGHANISGTLLVMNGITSRATISGSNIYAAKSVTGSHLYAAQTFGGAGLADCDTAGSSKLLWDATTKRFSCGTDQGTQWSNTGALQTAFDARYVNTSGDTMTGALSVRATLSGARLVISNNANISGSLLVLNDIVARGTLSGTKLTVSSSATISGALLVKTSITSKGSISGSTLLGFGLGSCTGASQKLLYNSSTNKFECGTITASTAFGTGNVITIGDARYVNASGDTMTGALSVRGTLSGARLVISNNANISGSLLVLNDITARGTLSGTKLTVSSSATISGALLVKNSITSKGSLSGSSFFGAGLGTCNGINQKVVYDAGSGKFSCATDQTGGSGTFGTGNVITIGDARYVNASGDTMTGALSVRATLSGSRLVISGNANITGALLVQGNITSRGTISGSVLHASATLSSSGGLVFEGSASGSSLYIASSIQGAGLTDCDAATQTLKWDAATGRFSCGTDINTQFSNTGSLQAAFDARYVNQSGDTVTGSLLVKGNLSGARLIISGNANVSGALLVLNGITTRGNLSGSTLTVSASGTKINNVQYYWPGYTYSGGYLRVSANGTLQWTTVPTPQTPNEVGTAAFSGAVRIISDSRYVNVSGDTMTGSLSVRGNLSGSTLSISASGTNIRNVQYYWPGYTYSGGYLRVSNDGRLQWSTVSIPSTPDEVGTAAFSGAVQVVSDSRYVNISGDTMTGALSVRGTLSGSRLVISGNANITGSLLVLNNIVARGTISGSVLHASATLSSSGGVVWEGMASGSSLYIGTSLRGAGLTDCTGGNKLLWDATSGRFSCGADQSAGSGLDQNSGDARYVRKSGDTMTGALVLNLTSGYLGLRIINTASGNIIHAEKDLTSSGTLTVNGATRLKSTLTILGTLTGNVLHAEKSLSSSGTLVFEGAASGSSLYVATSFDGAGLADCDTAGTSKLLWDSTSKRFSCGTDTNTQWSNTGALQTAFDNRYVNTSGDTMTGALSVRATLSGSRLVISNNANISGSLLVLNDIVARGTLSGTKLTVSSSATISGALLVKTGITSKGSISGSTLLGFGLGSCNGASQKLLYNSSTNKFECGIVTAAGTFGTGNVITIGDARYVNASGDTMTGALSVRATLSGSRLVISGNANITGALLTVGNITSRGTISGSVLHASATLSSSGGLVFEGSASGSSLYIASSLQGAGLTDCDAATQTLNWDSSTGRFSCGTDLDTDTDTQFSNTGSLQTAFDARYVNTSGDTMTGALSVRATLSGSRLVISGNAGITGALLVQGNITTRGTLSGYNLTVSRSASISGTLIVKTGITSKGSVSGSTILGFGLGSCNGASQKLLYNSSTNKFECGTISAAGTFSTGNVLTIGDARYVKKSGDTMTGALTINITNGALGTVGLKVINTLSGANIHAEKSLSSSGSVISNSGYLLSAARDQVIRMQTGTGTGKNLSILGASGSGGNAGGSINIEAGTSVRSLVGTSGSATSSGPLYATTQNGSPGDFGGDDWTKLNADDGQYDNYAWNNPFDDAGSDLQGGRALGFAIPSDATVTGITYEVECKGSGMSLNNVYLSKSATTNFNTTSYTKVSGAALTGTDTIYTFGNSSDLWGTTWTPTQINSNDFGIGFTLGAAAFSSASCDFQRVTVHYTTAASQSLKQTSAGTLTLNAGSGSSPVIIIGNKYSPTVRLVQSGGAVAIGKTTPSGNAKLDVLGTISGSRLVISNNAAVSGSLLSVGNIVTRATMSGTRLVVSSNANISGSLVVLNNITARGTLSGSRLIVSGHANISGALLVLNNITTRGTLSGANLTVSKSASISGSLLVKTSIASKGSVSGATIFGFGLGSCSGAGQKLVYNNSTNVFGCSSDLNTQFSNTGSLQLAFDSRYVNTSGDTMTGALSVRATLSGSRLVISGNANITGALLVQGNITSRGTISGATLVSSGNIRGSGSLFLTGTGTGGIFMGSGTDIRFKDTQGTYRQAITYARNNLSIVNNALGVGGLIRFLNRAGGDETMRLTSEGNIGIGTVTANSRLTISGSMIIGMGISTQSADQNVVIEALGTISGSVLHASATLSSSGGVVWEGMASGSALYLGTSLRGAGLTDCTGGNKLLWDATSGRFSCAADQSAASGLDQNSGDARYVRKSGDTMTGALVLNLTSGYLGLRIINTASGNIIHAEKDLTSSGTLTVNGATRLKSTLTILGTLTGNVLHAEKSLSSSGTLVFEGAASGSSLYVATSFDGAGLADCDTAGTSKLLWDSTSKRFSCGTDTNTQWSNTGALQTAFDARYVNVAGDTMTGTLVLQNGNTHTATNTPLLNVRGTLSGRSLIIAGTGASTAPLIYTDVSTGRVGIGTSAPSAILELRSDIDANAKIRVIYTGTPATNAGGGAFQGYISQVPTAAGQRLGNLQLGAFDSSNTARTSVGVFGYAGEAWGALASRAGYLTFETTPLGSTTRSERVRIDTNGYMGVGTTAPKSQVDVIGTISGSRLSISNNANITGSLLAGNITTRGTLSGSRLVVSGHGTISGSLLVLNNITARGTLSGTNLTVSSSASISGTLIVKTGITSKGSVSGATILGFGLGSCNGASQKLLYNSSTNKFECGTISASSASFSTGNVLTIGDARYVKKQGDTMTGALVINITNGALGTVGLKVINTLSGANIHAEKSLSSSGSVISNSGYLLSAARDQVIRMQTGNGTGKNLSILGAYGSGGYAGGAINIEAGTSVRTLRGGASSTPITLVQSTSAASDTSPVAVSWDSTTTAGNLLVAVVTNKRPGPTSVPTITPPAGWTLAKTQTTDLGNGHRWRTSIYYIENASARSGSESFTGEGYMGSAYMTLALFEYSGILTSGALDQTAGASAAATTDTTANSGTTGTTAQADELVIATFSNGASVFGTPTNSFTARETPSSVIWTTVADKTLTATDTPSTSATHTASSNVGAIATFKAIGGGVASTAYVSTAGSLTLNAGSGTSPVIIIGNKYSPTVRLVQSGGAVAIGKTVPSGNAKLDVLGTISGSRLVISNNANISGSLLSIGNIVTRATMSGARLVVSNNANISGSLVVLNNITARGTLSGTNLTVSSSASISGTLIVKTGITSKGSVSGATILGFGLGSCTGASQKLLYNNATNKFECGTISAAGTFSTGNVLTIGDARYVRKSGDTMTGVLTIDITNGSIGTVGLKVINTLSGARLHAERELSSSGTFVLKNRAGTATGNIFVVDTSGLIYDATNKRVGVNTTSPDAAMNVVASAALGASSPVMKLEGSSGNSSPTGAAILHLLNTHTSANTMIGLKFDHYNASSSEVTIGTIDVIPSTVVAGSEAGYMRFATRNATAGLIERMRIDNNGDLGIGTTSAGSRLSVSGAVIIGTAIGSAAADTNVALEIIGTASGRVLRAQNTLASSGTLVFEGAASGSSLYVATSFDGAGLADCDTAGSSKLLWDATSKRFSCGTDQTGGSSSNWSNTGSLQNAFDSRYVNVSGDTMTGVLVIQNGNTHTATNTPLLNVRGTMSGRGITITGTGGVPLLATNQERGTLYMGTGANRNMTGGSVMYPQLNVTGRLPRVAVGSGSTGTGPYGIYVQDRYAYLVNWTSGTMQIFDVSNVGNPVLMSTVASGTQPYGIYVQGRYAYVANTGSDTVTIFDITNPKAPAAVSNITTGDQPYGIYVQGRYAYVTAYGEAALQIFDISNPKAVTKVGSVGTGTNPWGITVRGNYVYLVNAGASRNMQIIDATDPYHPAVKSSITVGVAPTSVAVQGNYAYVTNYGSLSVHIIDIRDPSAPLFVSAVTTGTQPYYVAAQGRYIYVATAASATLNAIDVSNPAAPYSVGTVATGGGSGYVYVQGRYAYVTNNTGKSFQIFDLGGAYVQQLEAGSLEVGSLSVRQNIFAADINLRGGMTVGTSLQVLGNASFGTGGLVQINQTGSALNVRGVLSGSRLVVSANATISGTLLVKSTIATKATFSGAALNIMAGNTSYVLGSLAIGKTTVAGNAKLDVFGTLSGSRLSISNNANISGALLVMNDITTRRGFSGNTLFINKNATFAGSGIVFSMSGSTVFNEQSRNVDFRIESDGDVNAFFVDASADSIGIGKSNPKAKLDVFGTLSGSRLSISNNANISGALLVVNNITTRRGFSGNTLFINKNATFAGSGIVFTASGGAVFNEQSNNVDFRIESDGNTNMFFVDASADSIGIGKNNPKATLDVLGTISGSMLRVYNGSTSTGAYISQRGNGTALDIISLSTTTDVVNLEARSLTTGMALDVYGSALTTGGLARFYSNSTSALTRNLVSIINNSSSATKTTPFRILQAASYTGAFIDMNGNAPALDIDSESTTQPGIRIDMPSNYASENPHLLFGYNGTFDTNFMRYGANQLGTSGSLIMNPTAFTAVFTDTDSDPTTGIGTDYTTEAKTSSGTPIPMFTAENPTNEYFYVGLPTKFGVVNFNTATPGTTIVFQAQYYNTAGVWTELPFADGTSNLSQDGTITFNPPAAWAITTIPAFPQSNFYVRFHSIATNITKVPSLYSVAPTQQSRLTIKSQAGDNQPLLYLNNQKNIVINSTTAALGNSALTVSGGVMIAPGVTTPRLDQGVALEVVGTISGTRLDIAKNATVSGALFVINGIKTRGTLSGNTLFINKNATFANSGVIISTSGATVFNEQSRAVDFRIESDGDANAFFVDASTDFVGIGKSNPKAKLDVFGTLSGSRLVISGNAAVTGALVVVGNATVKGTLSGATAVISGNTTIGTASANGRLTVRGVVNSRVLELENTNASDTNTRFIDAIRSGSDSEFIVYNNGDVNYDGTASAPADYAEWMETNDTDLVPGELVSLDPNRPNAVKRATGVNDQSLFGVISTKPGILGTRADDVTDATIDRETDPSWKKVAFLGQVPTKVTGLIRIGDSITSSEIPGVGRKAALGQSVVCISMEAFSGSGTGIVNCVLARSNLSAVGQAMSSGSYLHARDVLSSSGALSIETWGTFGSGILLNTAYTNGNADIFVAKSNVGGTGNTVLRINASGAVFSDSTFNSQGADYAEWFKSTDSSLKAGEVVCIDILNTNAVKRCDRGADTNVMGIISTNPAFIGNAIRGADGMKGVAGYVLVGLIGQVPAKVVIEGSGGTIRPGDSLTAASFPGYARKAKAGESTVGVALEGYDGTTSDNVINVLISRRNQSLTVETVEQKVLDSIASMNIGDEVSRLVQTASNNLDVDTRVTTAIAQQLQSLDITSQINLILDGRFASGSVLDVATFGSGMTVLNTRIAVLESRVAALESTLSGAVLHGAATVDTLTVNTLRYTGALILSGSGTRIGNISFSGSDVQIGTLMSSGSLKVMGNVTISGLATFLGDVHVSGELSVATKQAGIAVIPQGGTGVTVTFSGAFIGTPIVTATSDDFAPWRLRNRSQTGFTIQLKDPAEADITFTWVALSSFDPQMNRGSGGVLPGAPIPFPVNAFGQPVSGDPVWNGCIQGHPLLDSEGQPLSCARYHVDYVWQHPDLGISFTYNPNHEPSVLIVPDGYVVTVIESSSSSSSSVSSSSSSSSSEESSSSSSSSSSDPSSGTGSVESSSSSSASSESSSSSSESSESSSASSESSSSSSSSGSGSTL